MNELARPSSIRSWSRAPWLAVGAVCLGAMMAQIDSSIVTLAYPTLQRHFRVSLGAVTWVGLAYLLTVVGTLVAFGRFSDMFGRKLIYVYGFVVFLLGSVLCGLAPNLWVLVASRVVQALGGAMIQANSVAIVVLVLPVASRTKGLGFQAAAQALGLAIGPTLGGLILGVASWRWLFFVNVPVGLVALGAAALFIPRSRNLSEPRPMDWSGTASMMISIIGLFIALSFASTFGWLSPLIVGGFAVALVVGAWFVRHERRAPEPLISPELLHTRKIRRGLGAASLSYLALFGLLLTVPFLIERGLLKSTPVAGLVLLALPLTIGLVAPFAVKVTRRVGARATAVIAGCFAAGGTGFVALGASSLVLLAVGLAIAGVGFGLLNTVNNATVMSGVPVEQAAVGSAMLNTTRGIGTAFGIAAVGAVFTAFGGSSHLGHQVLVAFRLTVIPLAVVSLLAGLLTASVAQRRLRTAGVSS